MKYFRAEEDPAGTRLPDNFVQGFLEVGRVEYQMTTAIELVLMRGRAAIDICFF